MNIKITYINNEYNEIIDDFKNYIEEYGLIIFNEKTSRKLLDNIINFECDIKHENGGNIPQDTKDNINGWLSLQNVIHYYTNDLPLSFHTVVYEVDDEDDEITKKEEKNEKKEKRREFINMSMFD